MTRVRCPVVACATTGSAGWMVLDGCKTPVFRYVGAGEGTLTDVAVSVQQYEPAV